MKRNLSIINGLSDSVISFDNMKNLVGETFRSVVVVDKEADTPNSIKKKRLTYFV